MRLPKVPGAIRAVLNRNKGMGQEDLNTERVEIQKWLVAVGASLEGENDVILKNTPKKIRQVLQYKNRTVNVALLKFLGRLAGHEDTQIFEGFEQGFKITGEIPATGLWRKVSKEKAWAGK